VLLAYLVKYFVQLMPEGFNMFVWHLLIMLVWLACVALTDYASVVFVYHGCVAFKLIMPVWPASVANNLGLISKKWNPLLPLLNIT